MANKQLADWIKTEEAQGYNEEQLRVYLTKQGYKQKDIEEAVKSLNPKKSFNQLLMEKGTLFGVLFYLIMASFFVPLLTGLIFSFIISARLVRIGYSFPLMSFGPAVFIVLFALFTAYLIVKKRLFPALYIMLLYNSLGFLLLGIMSSLTEFGDFAVYFSISFCSAVFGVLVFYMFSKLNEKMILKVSIAFSCVLALIFAINNMVNSILLRLTAQLEKIAEAGAGGAATGLMPLFDKDLPSMYVGFALCFVFFNGAFVYYFYNKKDMKKLVFYLIPIGLFVVFSLLFNGLVGIVMK